MPDYRIFEAGDIVPWTPVPGDARSVLMHADNRGVDYPDSRIMAGGECI
jgi:hypothetical protein